MEEIEKMEGQQDHLQNSQKSPEHSPAKQEVEQGVN